MQALFWLAYKHPAVSFCLRCDACGAEQAILARYCRHCRADLTTLRPAPAQVEMHELWSHSQKDTIDCLLVNHSLLATARSSGYLDLWSLQQPGPALKRLPLRRPVQAAALLDNLFVGLCQNQVEVLHLTPQLCQDACRYDRSSHFESSGPLASPLAQEAQRLVWVAGTQLVCYLARPQGLSPCWQTPLGESSPGIALVGERVFVLAGRCLREFQAHSGLEVGSTTLSFQPLGLRKVGQTLWIAGQRGELWKWRQGGDMVRSSAGHSGPCYSFQASQNHVVLCAGRTVHILDLVAGRQHALDLPQPCVLAPVLGDQWALLASYEGMLYLLALDQDQPRVVQARRPFSSFEPTTVPPQPAGDRLVLAGPEGQLAIWSL